MNKYLLFPILLFVTLLTGCEKEAVVKDCPAFKEALAADRKEVVTDHVDQYISELPSRSYTAENLDRLAKSISKSCSVTADVLCFDCIKTLPAQSEIRITWFASGQRISKVLDLSHNGDLRMRMVGLHD